MEPECGEDLFLIFFSLHLNLRGKIPKFRTEREPSWGEAFFWSSPGILFRAHQASFERERCLQQIQ